MAIAPAAVESSHSPDLFSATSTNSDDFHPLPIQPLQLLALPLCSGRQSKGKHPRLPAWAVSTSIGLPWLIVKMIAGVRNFMQQRLFEQLCFLIHLQADADGLAIL